MLRHKLFSFRGRKQIAPGNHRDPHNKYGFSTLVFDMGGNDWVGIMKGFKERDGGTGTSSMEGGGGFYAFTLHQQ